MTQLFVILSELPWHGITIAIIAIIIVGEALAKTMGDGR